MRRQGERSAPKVARPVFAAWRILALGVLGWHHAKLVLLKSFNTPPSPPFYILLLGGNLFSPQILYLQYITANLQRRCTAVQEARFTVDPILVGSIHFHRQFSTVKPDRPNV